MVVRDSLLYVAAKIVAGALGVATTSLLTRVFDPADYGLYGVALIVMTFGSSMLFDWIGLAFMRLYEARRHDPGTIPTFIALFALVLAATGVLAAASFAAGLLPRAHLGLWLAGIAMTWAFSLFELLARFEIADFRPVRYLVMNVGRGALMLMASGGVALAGGSPTGVATATAGALLAGCLFGRRRPLWPGPARFDASLAREAVLFGLPYAASMTLLGLTTTGTRAIVGWLAGDGALGLYTAAFALSQNVLVLIAAGIGSATYPSAVRAVEAGDPARVRHQLETNATVLLALLAPTSLGMALVAHDLAPLLVGHAYQATVALLIPWMAATSFLGGLRACYLDHAFQLGRKPGLQIRVAALAAGIGVVGTALLVPRIGVVGAAMATTVAMAVSCAHALRLGRRAFRLPFPTRGAAGVLCACAALMLAVLLVPGQGLGPLAARIAASASAYVSVLIGMDVLGLREQARTLVRQFPGLRPGPVVLQRAYGVTAGGPRPRLPVLEGSTDQRPEMQQSGRFDAH